MSVSSENDIKSLTNKDIAKDIKTLTNKNHIDLNDVLADLKHLSLILNNLTLVVSLYLADKGELDPKRFKIVPTPEDHNQQTPQQQKQTDNRKEDPS